MYSLFFRNTAHTLMLERLAGDIQPKKQSTQITLDPVEWMARLPNFSSDPVVASYMFPVLQVPTLLRICQKRILFETLWASLGIWMALEPYESRIWTSWPKKSKPTVPTAPAKHSSMPTHTFLLEWTLIWWSIAALQDISRQILPQDWARRVHLPREQFPLAG